MLNLTREELAAAFVLWRTEFVDHPEKFSAGPDSMSDVDCLLYYVRVARERGLV